MRLLKTLQQQNEDLNYAMKKLETKNSSLSSIFFKSQSEMNALTKENSSSNLQSLSKRPQTHSQNLREQTSFTLQRNPSLPDLKNPAKSTQYSIEQTDVDLIVSHYVTSQPGDSKDSKYGIILSQKIMSLQQLLHDQENKTNDAAKKLNETSKLYLTCIQKNRGLDRDLHKQSLLHNMCQTRLKRALELISVRDEQIVEFERLLKNYNIQDSFSIQKKNQLLKEINEIKNFNNDEISFLERWEAKRALLIQEEKK